MRKSNVLGGGLFILLAGVLLWHDFACPHPAKDKLYADFGHWLDENIWGDAELAARRLGLQQFVQQADAVEEAVFSGKLSLEDAVERIFAASQHHFPEFLDHLARAEVGASPQEHIARNIVRHAEEDVQFKRNKELCDRLQAQLAELLKKRLRGAAVPVSMAV